MQAKKQRQKVAQLTSKDIIKEMEKRYPIKTRATLGQRAADKLTAFVGSWTFLVLLFIFLVVWIAINLYGWVNAWDPYPFILLNFVLSCLAAVQAPIILMSQNREAERDRIRTIRDYMIDRKAEREVADMQKDLEEIKSMLRKIKAELRKRK
ncbi:hypothetical protein DRN74_05010 [Candidatus Micrarchaeota archaeon]|nr:MAG: hypothetical protein DRN74_05010 [Candidatus Micrarchaeota archaeon]